MSLTIINGGVPTLELDPGATPNGEVNAGRADVVTAAKAAFEEHGCIRLVGAFPPDQMRALRRETEERYSRYFPERYYADARKQGDRRTLVTLELDGGFGRPTFYANPWVYSIAASILGDSFILGHLALILSRPGSEDQFVHRDTPSLFGNGHYDAFMPTVGVAMVLPLISLDGNNGGTRVWPGTHRVSSDDEARARPSVVVELPLGGCLLFDVRTMHGGIGNRSDSMRSIIYGAYHRKWFRDWDGFDQQAPISLSARAFAEVPPELRHLFAWRFDEYGRWRRRNAIERVVSRLPPGLVVGARRLLRISGSS